jgi:hypothetical protein
VTRNSGKVLQCTFTGKGISESQCTRRHSSEYEEDKDKKNQKGRRNINRERDRKCSVHRDKTPTAPGRGKKQRKCRMSGRCRFILLLHRLLNSALTFHSPPSALSPLCALLPFCSADLDSVGGSSRCWGGSVKGLPRSLGDLASPRRGGLGRKAAIGRRQPLEVHAEGAGRIEHGAGATAGRGVVW